MCEIKKYELIETNERDFPGLYRVKALMDFGDIKAGDIGGFVSSEENLSQEGRCWIYDNAIVEDDAQVIEFAQVRDNAKISGNAIIEGIVKGRAIIRGNVHINYRTEISDKVAIGGNVDLSHCKIQDNVILYGDKGKITIDGKPTFGIISISGDVRIFARKGDIFITESVSIKDRVQLDTLDSNETINVLGWSILKGDVTIGPGARINDTYDYIETYLDSEFKRWVTLYYDSQGRINVIDKYIGKTNYVYEDYISKAREILKDGTPSLSEYEVSIAKNILEIRRSYQTVPKYDNVWLESLECEKEILKKRINYIDEKIKMKSDLIRGY